MRWCVLVSAAGTWVECGCRFIASSRHLQVFASATEAATSTSLRLDYVDEAHTSTNRIVRICKVRTPEQRFGVARRLMP